MLVISSCKKKYAVSGPLWMSICNEETNSFYWKLCHLSMSERTKLVQKTVSHSKRKDPKVNILISKLCNFSAAGKISSLISLSLTLSRDDDDEILAFKKGLLKWNLKFVLLLKDSPSSYLLIFLSLSSCFGFRHERIRKGLWGNLWTKQSFNYNFFLLNLKRISLYLDHIHFKWCSSLAYY